NQYIFSHLLNTSPSSNSFISKLAKVERINRNKIFLDKIKELLSKKINDIIHEFYLNTVLSLRFKKHNPVLSKSYLQLAIKNYSTIISLKKNNPNFQVSETQFFQSLIDHKKFKTLFELNPKSENLDYAKLEKQFNSIKDLSIFKDMIRKLPILDHPDLEKFFLKLISHCTKDNQHKLANFYINDLIEKVAKTKKAKDKVDLLSQVHAIAKKYAISISKSPLNMIQLQLNLETKVSNHLLLKMTQFNQLLSTKNANQNKLNAEDYQIYDRVLETSLDKQLNKNYKVIILNQTVPSIPFQISDEIEWHNWDHHLVLNHKDLSHYADLLANSNSTAKIDNLFQLHPYIQMINLKNLQLVPDMLTQLEHRQKILQGFDFVIKFTR
ncbi:hypothetical protein MJH12_20060, partial [bacterium]|nr:hypothetical protein [bacterium]